MSQTKAQLVGPVLGDVNYDSGTLFVDSVNNRIGIGTTNPSSQLHITGQFQSTQANSTTTGGGQIYLNGATGNRIDFNQAGVAAPTFTTRSAGTKLVLYPTVGASAVDFALGIDDFTLWYSVPETTTHQFKWYAGTTNIATLFGTGELVVGTTSKTGTASQPLQVTGGAYISGNVGIGTTNPTEKLHVRDGRLLVETGGSSTYGVISGFANNNHLQTFRANITGSTNSPTFTAGHQMCFVEYAEANDSTGWFFKTSETGTYDTVFKISRANITYPSGNFGIGTTNPDTNLHIQRASAQNDANGILKIENTNTSSGVQTNSSLIAKNKFGFSQFMQWENYGLRIGSRGISNGGLGEVHFTCGNDNVGLRIDSSGRVTKPYQPAFLAYNNQGFAFAGGWYNLSSSITTEAYDIGGNYGTSTAGRFVAPVAGRYLFYFGGFSVGNTIDARYAVSATVNGGSQSYIGGGNYSLVDTPLSGYSVIHNLSVNDYVELQGFSAIATTWGGGHYVYWGGYLLG